MKPRVAFTVLFACALAVLLGACGDGEVAGARFKLLTSSADGPVQGEVKLQAMDDGVGRLYDTVAVGGDVYVAPGAPMGKYRVFTTAGWGMLWTGRTGTAAPLLRGAEFPPVLVRVGKPRSLYVASGMPGRWTLSARWAADWKRAADGYRATFQRAPITTEDQGEGIIALRFSPDVWAVGNVIRVLGTMTDGTVTSMQSYQLRDDVHPELPRMALVLAATQAPLTVHLVPPPGVPTVADGTPVYVRLLGVALDHVYEAVSYGGRAQFDEIAALGHGLRIELPQSGSDAVFDLGPETWRLRQSVHVIAVDPAKIAPVELEQPGVEIAEVRACFAGQGIFGRVSFARMPRREPGGAGVVQIRTQPGMQEWWVRTEKNTWIRIPVRVESNPSTRVRVGAPPQAGVRIRGKVRGFRAGMRVAFRQILPAETLSDGAHVRPERRLGGEGLGAAVSPQGGYEAHLPPGRYEIRAVGPGGAGGRPTTLTLRAGAEARLDLQAR